jgi:hypothetical protein
MSAVNLLREKGTAVAPVAVAPTVIPATSRSWFSTNFPVSKYVYYGSIFMFIVIALIAIFRVHIFGIFTIDYSTGTFARIPVSPATQLPAQFLKSPIPATISTTFPSVLQTGYTVGFDVYIADGTPVQNNYRIIFYNGAQTADPTVDSTDPSQLNNVGSALSFVVPVSFSKSGSGDSSGSSEPSEELSEEPSDSIEGFKNTPTVDPTSIVSIQSALFANSTNICMYMAPDTNDLYLTYFVGHITPGKMGSSGLITSDVETLDGWNISRPIKNAPIGKPFRVSLVVDSQFIETYINGELVLTTKTYIPGQTSSLHSYSSSTNYNFYGPPDVMYLKGINVANIKYWNTILPSKAVRVFSSAPVATSIFTT